MNAAGTVPGGPPPRATVRLLAAGLGLAALLATAEGGAWLGFLVLDRRPFSFAQLAAERAPLLQPEAATPLGASRPAPAPAPGEARPGRIETTPARLALQPYFGITYDPEDPMLLAAQGRGALALDEHGFLVMPPLAAPRAGRPFDVALMGGSVAAFACLDGRAALDAELQAVPELRGRPLRLSCLALGAMAQPQTAAALNYLTILGRSFDAVIVLDGFNDIALPFNEHKFRDTFPAYPNRWVGLAGGLADPARQRLVGRVAVLQDERTELARSFERWPWARSVAASLVWRALDARAGRRLADARARLERAAPAVRSYAAAGPHVSFPSDAARLEHIAGLWERASLQTHRLARVAGARCFHFLQPNQYVPGSKPMPAAERALAWRADYPYRSAVEQGYPLLRQAGARLRAQGAHFEDLTQLFARVNEPLYVDDCCHVSPAGSAALGRAMGHAVAAAW